MVRNWVKIIIIFIITLSAISASVLLLYLVHDKGIQYPSGPGDYTDNQGDYQIDPATILSDLNQGNRDVFKNIAATPVASDTPFPPNSFSWNQSDYLKVASALHQFVWKENVDHWYLLYGMSFSTKCQDNPTGFASADFTFFRPAGRPGVYATHEVIIYPQTSGVSWGGGGYRRPLFGWKDIDLEKINVTADDALQIAEKNGGQQFRMRNKNLCDIHLILKPNPVDDGWKVYYYSDVDSGRFGIQIDPYTGRYEITDTDN